MRSNGANRDQREIVLDDLADDKACVIAQMYRRMIGMTSKGSPRMAQSPRESTVPAAQQHHEHNRERQLSRNPLPMEADGHCFSDLNGCDRSSAHIAGVENRKS